MTYQQLCRKQDVLLDAAVAAIVGNDDPRTARLTQLDLLFLLGGYLSAGPGVRGVDRLTALIKTQCARFPGLDDHMSYELIIDVNSQEYVRSGDIRVFSDGETARHERDFYVGHFLAEPFARSAASRLHAVVHDPAGADVTKSLGCAVADLIEFKLAMARYARLPRSAFEYFRKYLTSESPGRSETGPGSPAGTCSLRTVSGTS